MIRSLQSIAWGLFCSASWTWCIGMFLPIIMLQRYGWPGFLVFAVPNVIGCAAFGYVVRNRQRSEAMIAHHRQAMVWFSVATVAFHMYFTAYIAKVFVFGFTDAALPALAIPLIVLAGGLVISMLPGSVWLMMAVLATALSLAAFSAFEPAHLRSIPWQGSEGPAALAFTAPVIVFGFLLCPYLDLTFHRAIQHSPSRHSFLVFGIVFSAMILLTCFYAGLMTLPGLVLAHIFMQIGFTVGAHLREIRTHTQQRPEMQRLGLMLLPLAAVGLYFFTSPEPNAVDPNDAMYLRFLVIYGLLAPAYVLVHMFSRPTALRKAPIFIGAVVLAMPLYEVGFLHGRAWLLLVPAGAVVIYVLASFRSLAPDAGIPDAAATNRN